VTLMSETTGGAFINFIVSSLRFGWRFRNMDATGRRVPDLEDGTRKLRPQIDSTLAEPYNLFFYFVTLA
jgi:hypothetical protein